MPAAKPAAMPFFMSCTPRAFSRVASVAQKTAPMAVAYNVFLPTIVNRMDACLRELRVTSAGILWNS
eukprot:CAMPEP_0119108498 /NCGR_PEP_ID=MMETSP1180-20130426/14712_1 /TAXON_ID=3052 ORGANISM="Chlamydomonas cf sp, Strain CCMP681" /NCGR_SAMPLE_ID=MMETSP1180 /ASSEMBLY_ACC=CAM_ASM_000741 /LENGTH=66 /DNA_ID=CAMNT_0007094117 /DNA_START=673 /DNA_END=873 /DNA_ORIENTATION=-